MTVGQLLFLDITRQRKVNVWIHLCNGAKVVARRWCGSISKSARVIIVR